jgi:hypothetical protein
MKGGTRPPRAPTTQEQQQMPDDQHQPVTRDELRGAHHELEERLTETMRDMETNLLKAFHSYARGQAARMQSLEVTEGATQARMAALEERVLALETKRP